MKTALGNSRLALAVVALVSVLLLAPASSGLVASTGASVSRAANRVSIVGFWKVKLVSKGSSGIPDGTVIDNGFSQWHGDGTEITNSTRPPATQSFCLGVWAKAGQSRYDLNHFAISWKPDGTLLGPANLREHVTLSADGNSFEGSFTIDQYDEQGKLQQHIAGTIEGKRVTMTTSIRDVL